MKKEVMILVNSETLASIIESIIFVSGNAITIKDIAEKLEISEKQVLKEVEKLQKKYDENSGIKWLTFSELIEKSTEPHMLPVYKKIIERIKKLKIDKII